MINLIAKARLPIVSLLALIPDIALAQFGGRAGPPPGPPQTHGMLPRPPIMSAPVARQSALPLIAPPVSPILNRRLPIWGGFGGYSYYPYYPTYGYSQPNVIVNNNYIFPEPYIPSRTLMELPPLPNSHPNTARLTLAIPRGADVFVDGKKFEVAEAERTFESPDLKPGESFTFDVRVSWTENGKTVEEKRTLHVKAGEHQSLQYKSFAPPPERLDK
jgi:uncharacterized protein (TIGR03000 family)